MKFLFLLRFILFAQYYIMKYSTKKIWVYETEFQFHYLLYDNGEPNLYKSHLHRVHIKRQETIYLFNILNWRKLWKGLIKKNGQYFFIMSGKTDTEKGYLYSVQCQVDLESNYTQKQDLRRNSQIFIHWSENIIIQESQPNILSL